MNLYHETKFSPYFSFTVYCFYTKISSFMPALSTRIVLDCFYLLIFYSEKFSTDVCRLPYAVNLNLNLSNRFMFVFPLVSMQCLVQAVHRDNNTPYFSWGSDPSCSKVNNFIHWINLHPSDKAIGFSYTSQLDRALFGG